MHIILDGKKILTEEVFHTYIKKELDLPEYYGNNLDALWDCLTDLQAEHITLTRKYFSTSKKHLGDFADKALDTFQDAQKQMPNFTLRMRD
jgi:ribonuclease inhibitor